MPRRLSPDERALWLRVAGSVRPIREGASTEAVTVSPPTIRPAKAHSGPTLPTPAPSRTRQSANTLDGGWDKRIASGRVTPERTIDLHGCTAAMAHQRLDHGLELAVRDGIRVLLLITGRPPRAGASRLDLPLRGIIRLSVHDWLAASRHASRIAAIRPAHPRHGGAGALYVILHRRAVLETRS